MYIQYEHVRIYFCFFIKCRRCIEFARKERKSSNITPRFNYLHADFLCRLCKIKCRGLVWKYIPLSRAIIILRRWYWEIDRNKMLTLYVLFPSEIYSSRPVVSLTDGTAEKQGGQPPPSGRPLLMTVESSLLVAGVGRPQRQTGAAAVTDPQQQQQQQQQLLKNNNTEAPAVLHTLDLALLEKLKVD